MDIKMEKPEYCILQCTVKQLKVCSAIPSSYTLKGLIERGVEKAEKEIVKSTLDGGEIIETPIPLGIVTNWCGDCKFRNIKLTKSIVSFLEKIHFNPSMTEPITNWVMSKVGYSDQALNDTAVLTGCFFYYLFDLIGLDHALNVSQRDAIKLMEDLDFDGDQFKITIQLKLITHYLEELKLQYLHELSDLILESDAACIMEHHNAFGYQGTDEMCVNIFISRRGGKIYYSTNPDLFKARENDLGYDR